jgi:hypothetical protein
LRHANGSLRRVAARIAAPRIFELSDYDITLAAELRRSAPYRGRDKARINGLIMCHAGPNFCE